VQRDEHSWLVDGQYSVLEFLKYFHIDMEEELDDSFATVAGLIIHKTEALPEVGDYLDFEGYRLEVIDKDGQRIDKLLVSRLSDEGA
jgi:putative hemolysin